MKKQDRLDRLTAMISERGIVHLKDAARALDVSEMTIRRDIAAETGRFAFIGGHIMPAQAVEPEQPYELASASDRHASAKERASAQALPHIRAEDTLFIDCGSTMMHLADLLPEDRPLTVCCYALNIAERLARKPNVRLIMLGGVYHPASASFSGPAALQTLDALGLNVAFLSAAGLEEGRGATCEHFHEAEIKKKAMAVAVRSILILDDSKLGRIRPAFFAPLDAFDAIYTESGLYAPEENGA